MEAPGFLGDLSLYPDGIYGSTEEIERFAEASMEATLLLSDEHERTKIENEMDKMEQQYGTSKSREDHKQQYSLKFKDFIRNEILEDPAIETMSEEKLAYYLRRFYWSLRKKDGEPYKPSSLICIRAGISNYLNEAPVSRNIDILHGEKFQSANNMLKSMVGFWLKNGKEEIKHYDAIEMKDESLLYAYFDRSDPVKLQDEAWYILICHFGNRGREGMRDLTFESLESNADSNNCRYWVLKGPKKDKTTKPSLSRKHFTSTKQGRIYEDDQCTACPFRCIEMYLEKIKDCESKALFPKPCTNFKNGKWYQSKQVLGKTLLGNMMVRISKVAGLSKIYTNHCIRSTYVTALKDAGFKNDEICAITGHKDERSIARYDKRKCDRVLQKLSTSVIKNRRTDEAVAGNSSNFSAVQGSASKSSSFMNCNFYNCNFY